MAYEDYEIRTEDGKLFCRCQNNNGDVWLVGKNCSMSIQELVLKASNPQIAQQHRYKRAKKGQ